MRDSMKWGIIWILCGCLLMAMDRQVYGEEVTIESAEESIWELYDFAQVDANISDRADNLKFSDLVKDLTKGDFKSCIKNIKTLAKETLFSELLYNKSAILKILLLAVISAVFSNISVILERTEILETGFFITYILMITILISSFNVMSDMIMDVTTDVTEFIKIVIPSMVLSVGLCSGQASALGFGEITLFLIFIGEVVIKKVILPAVKLFVIIMTINNIMAENYFSKFGSILKSFIAWFLKFFMGVILGIDIIKGMILPGIDMAGKNVAGKLINLIPGASSVTAAGNILLSTASVVKNAIGGASIIILLLIVLVPVIKMLIFVAVYKVTAAMIQPVADKRITKCVDATADGVVMLNKILLTQVIMMSLSIAILCMVTS